VSDLVVNLEELREAASHIEHVASIPVGEDAARLHVFTGDQLGDDAVAATLSLFHDAWATGLEQLVTDLKTAAGLLGAAADEYERVDKAVADALNPGHDK
jgi:hypothetical protein